MIRDIVLGDITAPENKADIIIGMNSELADVTGIGLPFVKKSIPSRAIQLGSVISFTFDHSRKLHMIICHHLGNGGWAGAERHVRFGMDYLDHLDHMEELSGAGRDYSIVRIGTGRVGNRDGADHIGIHKAMADSHLLVDLFLYEKPAASADIRVVRAPLIPFRVWSTDFGEERLPLAA